MARTFEMPGATERAERRARLRAVRPLPIPLSQPSQVAAATAASPALQVVLLALADEVRPRPDGRLDLIGAAPEWLTVPTLPTQLTIPAAFVIGTDPANRGQPIVLECVLSSDASGEMFRRPVVIAPADRNYRHMLVPGALIHRCHAVRLTIDLRYIGGHVVSLFDEGGTELASVRFGISTATR
jgi:hypothetical protein